MCPKQPLNATSLHHFFKEKPSQMLRNTGLYTTFCQPCKIVKISRENFWEPGNKRGKMLGDGRGGIHKYDYQTETGIGNTPPVPYNIDRTGA